MSRYFSLALLGASAFACASSSDREPAQAAAQVETTGGDSNTLHGVTWDSTSSVWTIDLIRTLPGAQFDYVCSIETNWAGARAIVRERGAVLSYRAFVAPPATARGWDVLLMTEYADSAAYANREDTFRAIFASPEFVAVEPARPSAAMREFMSGVVVLRKFVSSGGR